MTHPLDEPKKRKKRRSKKDAIDYVVDDNIFCVCGGDVQIITESFDYCGDCGKIKRLLTM